MNTEQSSKITGTVRTGDGSWLRATRHEDGRVTVNDAIGVPTVVGSREVLDTFEPDPASPFASDADRLRHLADSQRQSAHLRPTATIDAEVMALVYEVAAGSDEAVAALRSHFAAPEGTRWAEVG